MKFSPMILIGNKIDLVREREVTTMEGLALAKLWNIPFFEISAKNNVNIDQILFEICYMILLEVYPLLSTRKESSTTLNDKKRCEVM